MKAFLFGNLQEHQAVQQCVCEIGSCTNVPLTHKEHCELAVNPIVKTQALFLCAIHSKASWPKFDNARGNVILTAALALITDCVYRPAAAGTILYFLPVMRIAGSTNLPSECPVSHHIFLHCSNFCIQMEKIKQLRW